MNKTLLRVWLVLWVITLPLIHIHPEADHAHGMSGHVHGGTYHSILVNTPVHVHQDHDQEGHHHDDAFPEIDGSGLSHSLAHSSSDFEYETYEFSVIKPTIDPDSKRSEISQDGIVIAHVKLFGISSASKPQGSIETRPFSILPELLSPRAPPTSSL